MKNRFFLCLAILLLILTACGNGDEAEPAASESQTESSETTSNVDVDEEEPADEEPGEDEPAPTEVVAVDPTDTPEPTEAPAPTDTPEAEEPETASAADFNFDLTNLESYAVFLEFGVIPDGANEVAQLVQMEGYFQVEPFAQRMDMTLTDTTADDEFSNGTITMVIRDGTVYSEIPGMGECISLPADQMGENPMDEIMNTQSFLDGFNNLKRVRPNETINGIETIHYVFDESTFMDEDVEFEEVTGDIYVAADLGYVVRMNMEGKNPSGFDLSDDSSPNDTFIYTFDLMSINEPVEITLPEGCNVEDQGAALPKPEGATQVANMGPMETYQIEMSGEDIVAFYQEALPAEGWIYNEDESLAIGALLTEVYSNGTDNLQILIAPNGDLTSVTLLVEPIE